VRICMCKCVCVRSCVNACECALVCVCVCVLYNLGTVKCCCVLQYNLGMQMLNFDLS